MSSIYRPKSIHEILPFEVISHAFTFMDPNDPDNGILPVKLSLVCSTFRDIALATSHVWTRIHVQVPKKPLTKELMDAIKSWIKRSRTLPCNLHLEFSHCRSYELPSSFLTDFIAPLASRLNNLSLRVPARFLNGLFEIKPFEFPLLESFTLNFPVDDNSPLTQLPSLSPTAFSGSTALDRLNLTNGSRLGFFTPKTIFSWHTLTYLKIHDLSISAYDTLDVFCLSTNLIHCELRVPGWRSQNFAGMTAQTSPSGSNPYQPPCIHPNLQVLWLGISSGIIKPFFHRLSLPKLQDLRILMPRCDGWEDLDVTLLELVVRQPMKNLRRFEVQGIALSVGGEGTRTLTKFLARIPSIEKLRLDQCSVFDRTFMREFIAKKGNKFLPRLKRICVLDDDTGMVDDATILSVMESRHRARQSLETVVFSHGPIYAEDFQRRLKAFQTQSSARISFLEDGQSLAEGSHGWWNPSNQATV